MIRPFFAPSRALPSLLGAACALAAFGVPALALPTTNPLPGPTGLGVIPTTQTAAPQSIETTLAYERISIQGGGNAQFEPFANTTFGFKKGEIGSAYARERTYFGPSIPAPNTFTVNFFAVHGKYRVYEKNGAALALGAHYYDFGRTSGFSLGNTLSLYATGSYDLPGTGKTRTQLHLGLLGQRLNGGNLVKSDSFLRYFAGVEVFAPHSQLSVAADYLDANKSAARAYSIAVRLQPNAKQRVGGILGAGRQGPETKYFASLTYRFGK